MMQRDRSCDCGQIGVEFIAIPQALLRLGWNFSGASDEAPTCQSRTERSSLNTFSRCLPPRCCPSYSERLATPGLGTASSAFSSQRSLEANRDRRQNESRHLPTEFAINWAGQCSFHGLMARTNSTEPTHSVFFGKSRPYRPLRLSMDRECSERWCRDLGQAAPTMAPMSRTVPP